MVCHMQHTFNSYKWVSVREFDSSVSETCLTVIITVSFPSHARLVPPAQRRVLLRVGEGSNHRKCQMYIQTLSCPFCFRIQPHSLIPPRSWAQIQFPFGVSPHIGLVHSQWSKGGKKQSRMCVYSAFVSLKISLRPRELPEPWAVLVRTYRR